MTDLAAPRLGLRPGPRGAASPTGTPQVLLITESGYPYQFGGVSTWCRLLVEGLPEVDYGVLAITGDPDSEAIFDLPANVTSVFRVPLWGTREALEVRHDLGLRDLRRARRGADDDAVAARVVPAFGRFVDALLAAAADPVELAGTVNALYEAFLDTDFDTAMRSRPVWETFAAAAQAAFPVAAGRAGYPDAPLRLSDVVTGLHWVHHWLLPLARPLPAVKVAHATMAGASALPAVALKLHHGARFVFSEHGIYLREAYLREASGRGSLFLKLLTLGFARRTSELSYAMADAMTTCCDYNQRWESRIGASPERVVTVHYGLDPQTYPLHPRGGAGAPVVAWVGRIDPIKDLHTLLRAAAVVHQARGDVVFRLYGAPPAGGDTYYQELLELRGSLGLDLVVEFAGFASDPRSAYASADVVVLSSVSEGFPFSTLEAMLSGKPVVATSVGGLGEQLGDCGRLVEPRNPVALAEALLDTLADPDAAARMGSRARERAKACFDLGVQNNRILALYADEARVGRGDAPAAEPAPAAAPAPGAGAASGGRRSATAAVEDDLDELARHVAGIVAHPVDGLEVATVIEADGINDAVAAGRYGAGDVFELGEEIFRRLVADRPPVALRPHDLAPPARGGRRTPELGRGLLVLLPAAVVLLIAHFLAAVPGWTPGTGRALMVGVTASVVVSNAVLMGMVRRSSLLIGCGRRLGTRRFLWRVSWVAALTLLSGEAIGLLVAARLGGVPGPELTTFALSFSGLAAFWLASAGFLILDRGDEPGAVVVAAVGVGVLVDRVLAAGSSRHLEIAIGVAYLVALGAMGVRVSRLLGRDDAAQGAYRQPRPSYVIDEALSYGAYGGLLMALLLGPNLLTGFVGVSGTVSAVDLSTVEAGMTLALVPLMVCVFVGDDAVKGFWEAMCATLSRRGPEESDAFCVELRRWHASRRVRYGALVAAISALCVPAAWLLAGTTALHELGVGSRSLFVTAFVVSLVAYLLLASAQFDSATMLTLAHPQPAVRSLAAGVLVAVVVAAATFPLRYPEVGLVALLAGTATAALAARGGGRRFLGDLPARLVRSM
ncbi:MAG: GT4 family glycosyltransferase PelF [Acidobacteriota bacterium]|nr:GT4 family glycosyltransferase PelF [Acidobacteriota bacterium]